jgi:chromate transporter
LRMTAVFVRAGSLVFGGGHVVLPLLRDQLVPQGWLADDRFLAGYGAAQALPGPLFTFSVYLGAAVAPAGIGIGWRALWAGVALVSLFGPGLLAAVAGLPAAAFVARRPAAAGALAGVNAAVVGVLGAALYDPIWTSAVARPADAAVAAAGFVLLSRWRAPPIIVVAGSVAAGIALQAVR